MVGADKGLRVWGFPVRPRYIALYGKGAAAMRRRDWGARERRETAAKGGHRAARRPCHSWSGAPRPEPDCWRRCPTVYGIAECRVRRIGRAARGPHCAFMVLAFEPLSPPLMIQSGRAPVLTAAGKRVRLLR
jgi:hypothetical protein